MWENVHVRRNTGWNWCKIPTHSCWNGYHTEREKRRNSKRCENVGGKAAIDWWWGYNLVQPLWIHSRASSESTNNNRKREWLYPPCMCSKDWKSDYRDTWTSMMTMALFTVAKIQNQLRHPSKAVWIKKCGPCTQWILTCTQCSLTYTQWSLMCTEWSLQCTEWSLTCTQWNLACTQ